VLFSASAELSIAVFDIGRSLREAREHRGLSPEDVQKSLNIRERYLTALEEERWELLPGEAYTKGFLRTYAEFLGLNGTLYIDEFNDRIAVQEDEPIVPESLVPRRGRSNLLTRTIVGIFVLAFVVFAASAWRPGSSAAPSVEAASAAPSKPVAIPVKPVVLHKPPTSNPKRHPKPTLAIVRAVNGRSWFSVRIGGPNGKEIFRGFLNSGHHLTYPLHPSVWMRIGRPRAVTIALGKRVVHGLPGTPANLLLTADGPHAG
jgi:cytoskeleton protein RodZ